MIRLSKSSISQAEKNAVMNVLDREYLGMGSEVKQFESDLSNFFGRKAICVVNGTAGLHLALQAIGINKNDEVLVPSITYVASFQAIKAAGGIPIACDVLKETLTLDPKDVEKRITKNTKAIMPVHYSGGVGDLNSIYDLASKYKLRVIEDAAHAFGSVYKNKKVGGFGDIACFSFDGVKNITSGEGGCIVSGDEELIKTIEDLRLLGVEKDTENRFKNKRSWDFEVKNQGWRYHMSNIMAAIGIEQLKRIDSFSSIRQQIAKKYQIALKTISDLTLLSIDYREVVPYIFPLILPPRVNRTQLRSDLEKKGIETGVHYYPNHKLTFFRNENLTLPITEEISNSLLTLPLHTEMSLSDVDYVCSELNKSLKAA